MSMPRVDPFCMYYVAVLCPPAIESRVEQHKLWMRDRFGCTVALKSPAHVTLVTPFWLDRLSEQTLLETLESVQTNQLPVEIQLQGFSHFSNSVLYISVKENQMLNILRKEVEDHFIQSFRGIIKPDVRPFHPHITIANRDMKPGDFDEAWQHFAKEEFEENFQTNTLSLLKLTEGKWSVLAEKKY